MSRAVRSRPESGAAAVPDDHPPLQHGSARGAAAGEAVRGGERGDESGGSGVEGVACGNPTGALEDAEAAAALKPGWSSAVIRRGEALAALGRVREALEVYERLADTDAEFRRSKQFLRKVKELEKKMEAAA
ncbi:unnamed protein product [Closterium sp. Yama58-4]|nr:unnamed protein product [Closterium sp. Yama58-4]